MPFRPTTIDFTQPALFKFKFDKIPHAEYFSYSVNLPGVSAGEIIQPTPIFDIKLPGDKMMFEPLLINFLVNEDLKNYREILEWMKGLYKPETTEQYRALTRKDPGKSPKQNMYSDAQLFILTNKMNPKIVVTFYDCYPIALSSLQYDSSITDVAPLTTDCTINYTYYDIDVVT